LDELFKAVYDGPLGLNERNTKEMFCSELVMETYIHWGVTDYEDPSNEYVPKDLDERHLIYLDKDGNFKLGKELLLINRKQC